jgi:hypothetical protein
MKQARYRVAMRLAGEAAAIMYPQQENMIAPAM